METENITFAVASDGNYSRFGGGGNSYTPPDVSIHTITVESGFAGSLTISAPDDTDLPQIGGVDDWDNWD